MNFLARWQAIATKTVRGDQHNEATAAAADPKERPLMALLAHLEKVGTGAAFNFSPKFRSPELSRAVAALTTLVLLIQLFFTPQAVDAQGATRSLVESVKHWIATAQDLAQHTQTEFYASSYVSGVLDQLQAGGRLAALGPEDLRDIQVTIAPAAADVTEVVVTLPPAINLRGSDGEGGVGGVYPSLETLQGVLDEWASIQGDPSDEISHRYHYQVVGGNDAAVVVTVVTTEDGQFYFMWPDPKTNTVNVFDPGGTLLISTSGGVVTTPTPTTGSEGSTAHAGGALVTPTPTAGSESLAAPEIISRENLAQFPLEERTAAWMAGELRTTVDFTFYDDPVGSGYSSIIKKDPTTEPMSGFFGVLLGTTIEDNGDLHVLVGMVDKKGMPFIVSLYAGNTDDMGPIMSFANSPEPRLEVPDNPELVTTTEFRALLEEVIGSSACPSYRISNVDQEGREFRPDQLTTLNRILAHLEQGVMLDDLIWEATQSGLPPGTDLSEILNYDAVISGVRTLEYVSPAQS